MVKISLLDKGPYYYHEFERALRPLTNVFYDENGSPHKDYVRDEHGYLVYEQPKKDWCLSYEPAYIMTDEQWLIERIREYARTAFDKVDVELDDNGLFKCSIPQERLDLCIPPKTRKHINKPIRITYKQKRPIETIFSDGYVDGVQHVADD